MNHTIPFSEGTVTNSPNARTITLLAPLLGVATAAWLIVFGLVLQAPGLPVAALAFLPAALLVLWVAIRKQDRSSTWVYAMMPVAFGLITLTILVGDHVISGDGSAFWVAGGLMSALPFLGVARGIRD